MNHDAVEGRAPMLMLALVIAVLYGFAVGVVVGFFLGRLT